MLSYFFPSSSSESFDNKIFGYTSTHMKKLVEKRDALKILSDQAEDKEALVCQKYKIIVDLVKKLEHETTIFNKLKLSSDETVNIFNRLEFSQKFLNHCAPLFVDRDPAERYIDILDKPRDNNRKNVDNALWWGSVGLSFSVTIASGPWYGIGVAIMSDMVRYLSGITEPHAHSSFLVIELSKSALLAATQLDQQYKQVCIQDALKILKLTELDSAEQVRKACRQLSLLLHPDRHPGFEESFKKLIPARDLLLAVLEEKETALENEKNSEKQKTNKKR